MTSWKEAYGRIQRASAEVVAISGDSIHSHRKFAQELGGLPYPMLADYKKQVIQSYGIHNPENGAARRSVFIVDKNGVVRYKNTAFNAAEKSQYEEVLAALEALS